MRVFSRSLRFSFESICLFSFLELVEIGIGVPSLRARYSQWIGKGVLSVHGAIRVSYSRTSLLWFDEFL